MLSFRVLPFVVFSSASFCFGKRFFFPVFSLVGLVLRRGRVCEWLLSTFFACVHILVFFRFFFLFFFFSFFFLFLKKTNKQREKRRMSAQQLSALEAEIAKLKEEEVSLETLRKEKKRKEKKKKKKKEKQTLLLFESCFDGLFVCFCSGFYS